MDASNTRPLCRTWGADNLVLGPVNLVGSTDEVRSRRLLTRRHKDALQVSQIFTG